MGQITRGWLALPALNGTTADIKFREICGRHEEETHSTRRTKFCFKYVGERVSFFRAERGEAHPTCISTKRHNRRILPPHRSNGGGGFLLKRFDDAPQPPPPSHFHGNKRTPHQLSPARVASSGPAGVDVELVGGSRLGGDLLEDGLGCRAPADVAEADEQHPRLAGLSRHHQRRRWPYCWQR